MASMACYQFTVVDEAGNVRPAASVRVDIEGGGLATLYSDRSAATPLGNPFTADTQGFAQFFLAGGVYKITAAYGSSSRVWRYVPISRASEMSPATDGYVPFASDNGLTTDSNLFWDNANKRFGVGTTAPNYSAQIHSAASHAILQLTNATTGSGAGDGSYIGVLSGGSTLRIMNQESGAIEHYTSGALRTTLDSSGNLGVNTASPDAKLSVNGVASFGAGAAALPSIAHFGDLDTGMWFPAANIIAFSVAGAEQVRINATGLGIGPGTGGGPYSLLDVAKDQNAATAFRVLNLSTGVSALAQFTMQSDAGQANFAMASVAGGNYGILDIASTGDFYFRKLNATGSFVWTTGGYNERMRINADGLLTIGGAFGVSAPVTKTADFSLAATENSIICNKAGTTTVTLPAASSWTGRRVRIQTITAQTVVSASSNVVPSTSATAGTAILAATAGKWAEIESDGTNWKIMCNN